MELKDILYVLGAERLAAIRAMIDEEKQTFDELVGRPKYSMTTEQLERRMSSLNDMIVRNIEFVQSLHVASVTQAAGAVDPNMVNVTPAERKAIALILESLNREVAKDSPPEGK